MYDIICACIFILSEFYETVLKNLTSMYSSTVISNDSQQKSVFFVQFSIN